MRRKPTKKSTHRARDEWSLASSGVLLRGKGTSTMDDLLVTTIESHGCLNYGPAEAALLGRNTVLTALDLRHSFVRDEGAIALAQNTVLKRLNLAWSQIGPSGAMALAANPSLTDLNLEGNHIGDQGALALASNTTLTSLNIVSNQVGDEGVLALARNTGLRVLRVAANRISQVGAEALAGNQHLHDGELCLAGNLIGDQGARALAQQSGITSLDLADNRVGLIGALALAASTNLVSLNLANNPIGERGVRAFLAHPTLTALDLSAIRLELPLGDLFRTTDHSALTSLEVDGFHDSRLSPPEWLLRNRAAQAERRSRFLQVVASIALAAAASAPARWHRLPPDMHRLILWHLCSDALGRLGQRPKQAFAAALWLLQHPDQARQLVSSPFGCQLRARPPACFEILPQVAEEVQATGIPIPTTEPAELQDEDLNRAIACSLQADAPRPKRKRSPDEVEREEQECELLQQELEHEGRAAN